MFKFLYVILRNLFRAPYMIPRMRYEADHPEKFTEEERYRLAGTPCDYAHDAFREDRDRMFRSGESPKGSGVCHVSEPSGKI